MSGKSSSEQAQSGTTSQTTTPWAPAAGTVSGLLGNLSGISSGLNSTQQGAINTLSGLGAQGNPYAGGISNTANSLLAGGGANNQAGMVGNAYSQYGQQLSPYLQKSFLDPRNTPGFSDALSAMNSDITNQVNGQFAAAGRSDSGMNKQTLMRGLAQGEGQLIANQYNQNAQNQLGAMASLYGAGNSTGGLLSGLQQQYNANQQAGVGTADSALSAQQYGPMLQLQAMSYQTGIPLQTLATQMGIALPAGQAFGTTAGTNTGTATGSNTMSGAQQFATIAGGAKNLFQGGQAGTGILSNFGYPGFGVP